MEQDASKGHTIIFTLKNLKAYKKGNASQLTAIDLRLKLFCKRLVQATGHQFEEPSLFQYDSFIEVRILIPDVLKSLDDLIFGSPDGPSPLLSFREQEIVDMVRNGYDNIGISSNLGITHATVKQHLKAIYRKLEVNSRIDLVFR
jgi:DNA-binding NarL/FixJ family response regulator